MPKAKISRAAPTPSEPFDQPGSLIKATLNLVQKDGRNPVQLYRDTGLPFHWLTKFIHGDIDAPSVNRVQYLYEKLSGKKITL